MQFLLSHNGVRRVIGVAAIVFFLCFCIFPVMQPPAQAVVVESTIIISGIVALLAAWGVQLISSNATNADITAAVVAELQDYPNAIINDISIFRAGVLKIGASVQAAAKWIADKFVSDGLSDGASIDIAEPEYTSDYYTLTDGTLAFASPIGMSTAFSFSEFPLQFRNGVTWTFDSSHLIRSSTGFAFDPNWGASPTDNYSVAFERSRLSDGSYRLFLYSKAPSGYTRTLVVYDPSGNRWPQYFSEFDDLFRLLNDAQPSGFLFQAIADNILIPDTIDVTKDQYVSISIPGETLFSDEEQANAQIIGSVVSSTAIGAVASDQAPAVDLSGVAADVGIIAGVLNPDLSEDAEDYKIADLKDVFPFCIPFDIYHFFSVLEATREAPAFDYPFTLPEQLGGTYELEIDLSDFDIVATVLRTMELLAFCVGLAFVTRKLIRG